MTDSTTELMEKAGTLPQIYRPISPTESYSREPFLFHQDTLNDFTKYRQALDKDPNDLKAREKFSKRFIGDKTFHVGLSETAIREKSRETHEGSLEAMARYTEHNFDEMFSKLDERGLQRLLFSVPLYKTEKDEEHNALVELIGEVGALQKIAQEKDIDKMRKYLTNAVKEDETLPDYAKRIISYLINDDAVVYKLFSASAQAKNGILSTVISEGDKLNEPKVRTLIRDSLQIAKDALETETDKDTRNDIWEDVVRPYYTATAEALFEREKAEYEAEHTKIDDKNKRETARRVLRMAT